MSKGRGFGLGPREHTPPYVSAAVEKRPVVDRRLAGTKKVLEVGVDRVSEPLVGDPSDLGFFHVQREPLQK